MNFCSEVFACLLVMVRNKKVGIIGHLFRLKTETSVVDGSKASQGKHDFMQQNQVFWRRDPISAFHVFGMVS